MDFRFVSFSRFYSWLPVVSIRAVHFRSDDKRMPTDIWLWFDLLEQSSKTVDAYDDKTFERERKSGEKKTTELNDSLCVCGFFVCVSLVCVSPSIVRFIWSTPTMWTTNEKIQRAIELDAVEKKIVPKNRKCLHIIHAINVFRQSVLCSQCVFILGFFFFVVVYAFPICCLIELAALCKCFSFNFHWFFIQPSFVVCAIFLSIHLKANSFFRDF